MKEQESHPGNQGENFDPRKNYRQSKEKAGYISKKEAIKETYDRIGFMPGVKYCPEIFG